MQLSDGIVLLAKKAGPTSFGSLRNVKKALNTTKVGHTGTLDSFAQGLLVVCTGRLTKLAGNITEFDKSYKAVIKFGSETDTLEYTGQIIRTADLPYLEDLKKSIKKYTGEILQAPPAFSAIHVDGKRASDLARKGNDIQLPERPVTVFKAELESYKLNEENKVEYALINFSVSKGTYIRSLARDIAKDCNSAAHLVGLYRTSIGNFKIEDSAGFSLLEDFNIENCIRYAETIQESDYSKDELIQKEIIEKKQFFSENTSTLCGFINIHLYNNEKLNDFLSGKPLKNKNFKEDLFKLQNNSLCSVFYENEFYGMIEKNEEGRVKYKFVLN